MAHRSLVELGPGVAFGAEFVTNTQTIMAKKGSGKSYAAMVEAEELLDGNQQVVAIDPTGAWWGLRSSPDGRSTGYEIAVLGGEHADVPLEALAGEVVANAVATEHFSVVIDLSLFRKGEANRFVGSFLETLYRKNREPLHLFIDEADQFAPQRPFGDEARTLGACEDIVRRGRIRGVGCTLITQRPQVLNKNVLSQVDMLTVLRMNHPKDLGAVREWIDVHGDEASAKKMLGDLPALPIGEAWVWAPAAELLQRVKVRKRHTFDSGRTPRAGERPPAAKVLAPVNVEKLGRAIADTAAQVKANDPAALRGRVAQLERELVVARRAPSPAEVRAVIDEASVSRLRDVFAAIEGLAVPLGHQLGELTAELAAARRELAAELRVEPAKSSVTAPSAWKAVLRVEGPADSSLGAGERKILTALAQYADGRTKHQVAILAGYSHKGGGFNNYLSRLRSLGHLRSEGDRLWITESGLVAIGSYEPLPTGSALAEHWYGKLKKAERDILRVLVKALPEQLTKERVAVDTGYSADGGGFNNALSKLRTLELVQGKAKLRASDALA